MTERYPSNWVETTIGEVTVGVEKREPEQDENLIYIDISSIDREKKQIVSPKHVIGKEAPSRARQIVRADDVLVSMTRPSLNAVGMVSEELDGQVASTGFDVLRSPSLDPRWLFYLVQTTAFIQSMSELVKGVVYPAIRSRDVRNFKLPIAPLNEQNRVADKLDNLLARVNKCRERLGRVESIIKRLRQSILALSSSGKLTQDWRDTRTLGENKDIEDGILPAGWEWKSMSEVGSIQLGRQRAPRYHSGPNMHPYLRVQNIFEDRIDLSDVMEMDFPPNDFEKYQLTYGDILLNEGQSPELLGRPAMYRDELPGACFTNTLIRFQAFDIVNRDFALLVFRHYMHSGRFMREGKITTNIAHLSARRFSKIEFPLPSLEEQQEIVDRSNQRFAFADRIDS